MSRRDYIEEILEKKSRTPHGWLQGRFALTELDNILEKLDEADVESETFYSLILVGIASSLEVVVRNGIKELIDAGSPYLDNVHKFKDILKFDLNITRALHDKKISFGELVSHLLPINSVENILSHYGVLLDCDFKTHLAELREFVEPSDEELLHGTKPSEPAETPPLVIDDIDQLIKTISTVFTRRHITAHEADFHVAAKEDIPIFLKAAELLALALDESVEQTLRPNFPRNSFGISIKDVEEATKSSMELERLYDKVRKMIESQAPSSVDNLMKAQTAFQEYLEAEREFQNELANFSANGMRSLYASITKQLSEQRVEVLKEFEWGYRQIF